MDNKAMSKDNLAVIHMEPLNMSSTAKLTDRKDSLKGDYNPVEHRNIDHPNTDFDAMAHLLKGSLGTGVLAMPMAFKNAGLVFGMVGTIVVGIICTHTVHILVRSSQYLCRREQVPSLGFAETAEMAFKSGPPKLQIYSTFGRKFVNIALVATYYSAVCVYIVFVATSLKQMTEHYIGIEDWLNIRVYIPMLIIFLIPLGLIRDLKYLVPFSAVANIFIVISFAITLYYMFNDVPDPTEREMVAEPSKIALFFATVIFAMEGIGVVMPLENSMKTPGHFIGCPGVLNISMFIVVILYAAIGFFGYLKYGDKVEGSITINLDVNEIPAQIVKILYGLAILFSYGLQFYVPTSIVWETIEVKIKESWKNTAQNTYRVVVVFCTVGVAAAVPQLGPIISLVGALCFSTLGLFCPAMIETITYWEDGLGRYNWVLWKNVIIIIFAAVALVVGSYASILEIIEEY